jgi:hypothetical protein
MSTPSEDNLIDQSLRDVFRDYDLPPDSHPRVWEGVAERIATLPETSSGLPYRLLLPLTAVLGVGVGWLLPKPAATPAQPATQITQVLARPASQAMASATLAVTQSLEAPATVEAVAAPQVGTARPAVSAQRRLATPKPVMDAQRTAAPVATPADSASTTIVPAETAALPAPADAPPVAAPAPAEVAAPMPVVASTATNQSPQAAPAQQSKAVKPSGTYEKVTYRKLSQRQPERGTGIRRWFSHLFQSVKHLLG